MTDPLAAWYGHEVTVTRPAGWSGNGRVPGTPEQITGFYHDSSKIVIGADGQQTTASGLFAFPLTYDPVPVDSKVTLPAMFGGRTVTVIESARGDGGGQPTPDHYEIAVQ